MAVVLVVLASLWLAISYKLGSVDARSILLFYKFSFGIIILVSSVRLMQKHDRVYFFMIMSLADLFAGLVVRLVPETVDNSAALFYFNEFLLFHSVAIPFVANVLQYSRYVKSNGALYMASLMISVALLTIIHPSNRSFFLSLVITGLFYFVVLASVFENMRRLFYMVGSIARRINMISSVLYFISITALSFGSNIRIGFIGLAVLAISYLAYYITAVRL